MVAIDGGGVAGAEQQAGLFLPVGGEPADVGQRGGVAVAVGDECLEHAARFDRRELGVVADQQQLGPGIGRGGGEFVEGEGAR